MCENQSELLHKAWGKFSVSDPKISPKGKIITCLLSDLVFYNKLHFIVIAFSPIKVNHYNEKGP